MLIIEAIKLPVYPVFNSLLPLERSKGIPLLLDFSATSQYKIPSGFLVSHGYFEICQTIWIDTTDATAVFTVTVDRTNQRIQVKPNTQGYYPIVCPNQFGLTFESATTSTVKVILLNMPIQAHQDTFTPGVSDAMVFLGKIDASGQATIDFTSKLSAQYDNYMLVVSSMMLSINGVDFNLRMSVDNGVTYDSAAVYDWTNWLWIPSTAGQNGNVNDTVIQVARFVRNTVANYPYSTTLMLYGVNAGKFKTVTLSQFGAETINNTVAGWSGVGIYKNTAVVNAFRLQLTGGAVFSSGKFVLYGLQEA